MKHFAKIALVAVFSLLMACSDSTPLAAETKPAETVKQETVEKPTEEVKEVAAEAEVAKAEAAVEAPKEAAPAAPANVGPMRFMPGVNYEELEPQRTADVNRIEVKEVFWYGCSHCFSFEPLIKSWKQQQPADVQFIGMPAMWNPQMAVHARIYYTAQELSVLDAVHDAVFKAMNLNKKRMLDEKDIVPVFEAAGIDKAAFDKAWKSFTVSANVKRAQQLAPKYRIQGTPEMVVNGKYRVSAGMNGGQKGMLQVVDFLVAKERAALPKK
ncbi:MAG: thiol:disulfide interchange protein DsbA/DsbL [Cellvibrionaceae bacterium]